LIKSPHETPSRFDPFEASRIAGGAPVRLSRPIAAALFIAAAAAAFFAVRLFLRGPGPAESTAISPRVDASSAPIRAGSAEALTASALADLSEWKWNEAERGFRRALELDPKSASARDGLGRLLISLGRFEEGRTELEQALRLDTRSPERELALAAADFEARRYGPAVERCLKILKTAPRLVRARFVLAESYIQMGRADEALAECLSAVDPQGDPSDVAELGYVFAAAGKKDEALKIAEKLAGKNSIPPGRSIAFLLGVIYAGLDMREPAFRWFETAYRERASALAQLRIDPRLDHLRGDPRYLALVRKMGFPGS
jgi:tetratricopeptide (TPR) repeat protein